MNRLNIYSYFQRFAAVLLLITAGLICEGFRWPEICSANPDSLGNSVSSSAETVLVSGVSDGLRTYSVIRRNGVEYRTDQVGVRFNRNLWNELSAADRSKLLRIYGWDLNRRKDHFGDDLHTEMANFYNDEAGWTDLVEALKDRRMNKDYPHLRNVFGPEATLEIPLIQALYPEVKDSVQYRRAALLIEEVQDDFEIGRRLYNTLTQAKWDQVSIAVKGISGPLIKIMVDNFITPFVTHGAKATSELVATMYNFANELREYLTASQQPGANPPTPGELIERIEILLVEIEQTAERAALLVEAKLAEINQLATSIQEVNESIANERRTAGTGIVEDFEAQRDAKPNATSLIITSNQVPGTYAHWQDMHGQAMGRFYEILNDAEQLETLIQHELDEVLPGFNQATSDKYYHSIIYTYFAGIDQSFQGSYLEPKNTLTALEPWTRPDFYQPDLDDYSSSAGIIITTVDGAENRFNSALPLFNQYLAIGLALDQYQYWMGTWQGDETTGQPVPATWKASERIGLPRSVISKLIPVVASDKGPNLNLAQDNILMGEILQPAAAAMATGRDQRRTWMQAQASSYSSLFFNFESSLHFIMATVDDFDALHANPVFKSWFTFTDPHESWDLYEVNIDNLLARIAAQPTAADKLTERLEIVEQLNDFREQELILERRLEIAHNYHLADFVEINNFTDALWRRFLGSWTEIKQDFKELTGVELVYDYWQAAMDITGWRSSYYYHNLENPSWVRTPQKCRSWNLSTAIERISGKTYEYYLLQDLYHSMEVNKAYYLSMSSDDFADFNRYVTSKIGTEPNLGEWIVNLQLDGVYEVDYPARRLVAKARGRQQSLISLYNGFDPQDYFTGINGMVTTQAGIPVPGANIRLTGAYDEVTTTDSLGFYQFEYLPQGNYTVIPQGSSEFEPASRSLIFEGQNIMANFILPSNATNGYTISGRLVDDANVGMAGIRVQLLTGQGVFLSEQLSDTNGYFTIIGLAADSYKVLPVDSGFTFDPVLQNLTTPPDVINLHFTARDVDPTGPIPGDLNGDGEVNMVDLIISLKVVAGIDPGEINVAADVDANDKIGLAEAIYIMEYVTGIR